jgi:hypothetical protein
MAKKHPSNIGNIFEQGMDSEADITKKHKESAEFKKNQRLEKDKEKKAFSEGKRFRLIDILGPKTWKLK